MKISNYPKIWWPEKMLSLLASRDLSKHCQFHKDHRHETSTCITLKNQIEELIRKGRLVRFVQNTTDANLEQIKRPQHQRPLWGKLL